MLCPKCGNRPLTFVKWLRKANPMRIQCGRCNASLRAGPPAYVWTLGHAPLAIGLFEMVKALGLWFLPVALGVVFCTAYVIPYYAFNGFYQASPPAA